MTEPEEETTKCLYAKLHLEPDTDDPDTYVATIRYKFEGNYVEGSLRDTGCVRPDWTDDDLKEYFLGLCDIPIDTEYEIEWV